MRINIASGRQKQGITLVEVLVVIAIISLLAAISFPALAAAHRRSLKAVAASDMHQCSLALSIYMEDQDDRVLPPRTVMKHLTEKINCDPGDYWRSNCGEDLGVPMVGSFGYVGSLPAVGQRIYSVSNNPPIFADVFYTGNSLPVVRGFGVDTFAYQPASALVSFGDGSVRTVKLENQVGDGQLMFNWLDIFANADSIKLGTE